MIVEGKWIFLWTRVRFSPAPFFMGLIIINMNNIINFFNENSIYLLTILCIGVFVGYLFGSIPVGYLYCKFYNVNILEFGSGNPGSTNVGRALGKKHGRVVFILDILKIILPVLIVNIVFNLKFFNNFFTKALVSNELNRQSLMKFFYQYITTYTGLGGILGHNYPLYLHFKGGKGVSCTMGTVFCISPLYSIILFLVYKITTKITKYVSVGSLTAVTALFISSIVFTFLNIYPYNYLNNEIYGILLLPGIFLMWALSIFRHKSNIIRLINGTENKI